MDVWTWWRCLYRDRIFRHLPKRKGIYVIDEPWDSLIILDACRYDAFKELNTIDGKLERRISRGSDSTEFLLENFARHPERNSFGDVVYVAGNPYVSALLRDKFYRVYSVWDHGWDDDLQTVPPCNVVSEALKVRTNHPEKRMIIHFMQPHFPALTGKLARQGGGTRTRRVVQKGMNPLEMVKREGDLDITVETLLERGELDRRDVTFAYKENLRIVLFHVAILVAMLPGRTVVTSDHGEVFGERPGILYPFKVFGHPAKLHVEPLVVVPWLIVDNERLRTGPAEEKETKKYTYSEEEEEKIKDRLRKLGYMR
ncbi:hypothetical protein MUP05_08380 [Candidatus Bathyarchaeota archaeon]|nr:hypothetical protein [Candidatus Bathyarchaeota archaeon]